MIPPRTRAARGGRPPTAPHWAESCSPRALAPVARCRRPRMPHTQAPPCMYVCVCMHVCIYVCMYVSMYVCMYLSMHVCMYVLYVLYIHITS